MGGGKGGGEAYKSYDYYATIAGAVCVGPVDAIHSVVVDGKAIFEGTLSRPGTTIAAPADRTNGGASPTLNSEYVELTGVIDSRWCLAKGYLRLYWGTDTQAVDPAISGFDHPPYAGVAYLVARKFLFGRERSAAPNIEVVVSRRPVCPTAICAEGDNVLDDLNCNPVAALGELLTSQHGLGLPVSRLDSTSWLAAAAWCNATADRRERTFCSPLLNTQKPARQVAAELLALFDGALAWTASGTLAIRLLEPGVNPGGLTTLDAQILTEQPRITSGGWGDIPSGVVVRFADRDRLAKESDEVVNNLVALRAYGEDRRDKLDAPHVVRRSQAHRIGSEYLRRSAAPGVTIDVQCRRERVSSIAPGSKVLIDVDPEPGGAGLAQLCVVTELRDNPKGGIRLTCEADTLVAAIPYTPNYPPPAPQAAECDPIAHALLVPLPRQGWPGDTNLGVLTTRPQADCIGVKVYLSADGVTFDHVGNQIGFAVRASLDTGVSESAETLTLTLTDGADGLDSYLIERTIPGGNQAAARADQLLAVLANLDGNGRVIIGSDGHPELEFVSLVSRSAVDADTHTYTVLRARRGPAARAWTTSATVWITPIANIVPWTHPDLRQLLGTTDPAYARLTAYTAFAQDDSPTPPERTALFPDGYDSFPRVAWTTPATTLGSTDSNGDFTLAFTVSDRNGDLVRIRVSTQDTAGNTVLWTDVSFAPTLEHAMTTTLSELPVGAYTVVVEAIDREGHVTTDTSRTIQNITGGAMPVPTLSPSGSSNFTDSLTITITGASPADRLQYSVVAPGSLSTGTIVTTTAGTLSAQVTITSSRRIWTRAGDGGAWSQWRFGDYNKDIVSIGGGGGGRGSGWPPINQN